MSEQDELNMMKKFEEFANSEPKGTLLIDDVRNEINIRLTYNIEVNKVAKNYSAGIEALKSQKWDTLCLDHDLASWDENGVEKTGYDIMKFLEEFPQYMPVHIIYVSANPVGVQNMRAVERSIRSRSKD